MMEIQWLFMFKIHPPHHKDFKNNPKAFKVTQTLTMKHQWIFVQDLLIVHFMLFQGRLDSLRLLLTNSEIHCHISSDIMGSIWIPEIKLERQAHC